MAEKLVDVILGLLGGLTSLKFGKEIIVFIISLLPILELRGGLIAASLLGLNAVSSYIIAVIGNILPIPFILWFMKAILDKMRISKFKKIKAVAKWLDKKVKKHRNSIEKYGFWGLVLFVGIPLPGTGAWTGCLIASVLEMDKKKSLVAALLGVFLASIIMMLVSFGILRGIIS